MALIQCSECGKEISDKAASCPHCGVPMVAAGSILPAQEAVYLLEDGVTITNTMALFSRAIILSGTYNLADITSATVWQVRRAWWRGIFFIPALPLLWSGVTESDLTSLLFALFVGGLGFAATYAAYRSRFAVRISSSSGESNVFFSADQARIQRIVDVLNEAISRRR